MHKVNFLICYDIKDKKRLQKMYRLISNHALQVQYSVYYATLYKTQMDELIKKIQAIIKPKEDDVRIYITPPLEKAFIISKRCPDVMIFGDKGERLLW